MECKAVVFDLDGTLLNTLEDLADTGNKVLEEHGLATHAVNEYRYFVGDGLQTLLGRILPEHERTAERIEYYSQVFRRHYRSNWNVKSKMYPGIAEMLEGLQARQLPLTILSNKPHEFTKMCVQELLADFDFHTVLGVREDGIKKPDPAGAIEIARLLSLDPASIYYLGDTATDMLTANRAGMFAIGVGWGFRPVEELQESGARVILDDPPGLLTLID